MSNVQVQFKRGDTSTLNNTPITDGMIYFNTENKHIYMDNGSDRLEYYDDMSNFINKPVIENLIDNNSPDVMRNQQMNAILGDRALINGRSILDSIDSLYSSNLIFETVWQDNSHEPYYEKTIRVNGVYQFFIISFGSYEEGEFNAYINLNSWKANDDNFDNLAKYYLIATNNSIFYMPSEESYSYAAINTVQSNNSTTTIPNNVPKIYNTYPFLQADGGSDGYTYKKNTRKVSIEYDDVNNQTVFTFYQYNDYYASYPASSYPSSWVCGKYIPYFIVGIRQQGV